MQRADRPQLTSELLQDYGAAAMQNAAQLIEEGVLLRDSKHFARAYFLAVAAIEEIGKALIAFDARGRNLRDSAVQSKVARLLGDHDAKIRTAFTGFLEADPRKNVDAAIKLILALQRGREPAMYTDLEPNGKLRIPATVVGERAGTDCVRLARDCFGSAEAHMSARQPLARTIAQDQWFAMRSSDTMQVANNEDFWWFFISRMEQGNKDMAEAVIKYRQDYLLKDRKFRP